MMVKVNQQEFNHLDKHGKVLMVDVSSKKITSRVAVATGNIKMQAKTLTMITNTEHKKGDVLATARVAGIMAAKNTSNIVPMCHNLNLSSIKINFDTDSKNNILIIKSTVKLDAKTGAEMEALTAVSVTALTIYDMCKAVDSTMEIGSIKLIKKLGGKSDLQFD